MNFDINDLTIGEVADIEEATGKAIGDLFGEGTSQARTMQAILWIVRRRDEPGLTFEQAGDMTFAEMNEAFAITDDGGDVDPQKGAG
jgi:hypothetical protein